MTREDISVQIAILVSLLLHVGGMGAWQGREFLSRLPLLRSLVRAVEHVVTPPRTVVHTKPNVQTLTFVEIKPKEPERERAKTFTETDPSQVTGEQPKKADFYSDKSTVAANEKNPTKKTGDTPFLDGKETRFLAPDTVVPKPGPSTPAIPPAPAPKPVTPPPPKPPAPEVKPTPPNPPAPEVKPAQPKPAEKEMAPEGQKVVEPLDPAKEPQVALGPKPPVAPQVPFPLSPSSPVPAIAMPTPGGGADSGREISTAKTKLTATGISRTGVNAFNVQGSPFGEYDKKLVKAVQSRWYALIERYGIYERAGEVTVYFQLYDDGTVHAMAVPKNSAGEILSLYCQKAIVDSAPFDPLPDELRRLIGKDPREVNFTFYY